MWTGLLVSALCFASYVATENIWGGWTGLVNEHGEPPLVDVGSRISLILSLLIGYMGTAVGLVTRASERDARAIRALIPPGEDPARRPPNKRAALVSGLLIAPMGALIVLATNVGTSPFQSPTTAAGFVWGLVANVVLFFVMGHEAYRSRERLVFFQKLEDRIESIDLLDVTALAPAARPGLRVSLVWIGGFSISMLLFTGVDNFAPVAALGAAGLAVGIGTFLFPLRRLRSQIAMAKQEELGRVRAAIRQERDATLDPNASAADGSRLPALLAYETRIASVSEWPIDTRMRMRFGLYLALPLGSWLGGAVVERLLAALLET